MPTVIGSTSITITLPDATSSNWWTAANGSLLAQSKLLRIKRRDTNSSGSVTLVPGVSGQTIEGATSKTLSTLQGVAIATDGANLWLV